ncbi:MAG TPA: ABC transporter permease, partial [Phycisphaerales bacterium]|nr:ABC transporter permease [Phycisphaerales bacterium]
LVSSRFLTTNKVKLGDTMTLATGRAQKSFTIVGAVDATGLEMAVDFFGVRNQYMEISTGCVFVDWNTVKTTFDSHDAYAMLINLKPGVSDAEAREQVLSAAPGVEFQTSGAITDTLNEVAVGLLVVQSTIAFAALVLASIGMGNVILANIHTRRFEYGVLRAVGAGNPLLVRLILSEAIIIAIVAAVVGIALGLHLAAIGAFLYRDLLGLPVRFVVPVLPTLAGIAVLLALTCLVAIPGARRMTRSQPSELLAGGRNA